EGARATLAGVSSEYADLADRMLRQAKRSRGLIDSHLRESYGSDVDSLYYYVMNMKRFAVRLSELGLDASVRDIRERVERAVAEFTDEERRPIVEEPRAALRVLAPVVVRLAARYQD